jgi:formate/nitrite transporter FocA (FNT family)
MPRSRPGSASESAAGAGAVAFGIGFVFVVVGRSELFTENFLVPIAALERSRASWLKLGELWVVTLVLNLAGGALLAVILTSQGVLRPGSAGAVARVADHLVGYGVTTGFLSALVAGALMTLMTWLVEGAAATMGVRLVMAWLVGSVIALGTFNHAIVSTVELVFGMRYGASVSYGDLFTNLGVSVAGNLVGGLALVTFARFAQTLGSRSSS